MFVLAWLFLSLQPLSSVPVLRHADVVMRSGEGATLLLSILIGLIDFANTCLRICRRAIPAILIPTWSVWSRKGGEPSDSVH